MRAKDHRLGIPLGVKLHACLLLLGFTDEEITGGGIQWDHAWSLNTRTINADGEMDPHPNDPRYIVPLRKAAHDIKTRGSGATTAGSDVGKGAKLKRIEKDPAGGAEFRRKLLTVKTGLDDHAVLAKRKTKWPSRPFNSKGKKT